MSTHVPENPVQTSDLLELNKTIDVLFSGYTCSTVLYGFVFQRLPQRPISTQDPGESTTCLLLRRLLKKTAGGAYCVSLSRSRGIQAALDSPTVPLTPLLSLPVSGLSFYPH
jgi:hypothetical protein